LALEIRWLQVPAAARRRPRVVQRANARKAARLDQPRFFGEFLSCPKRRLDKTRIGRNSALPRFDRERLIRVMVVFISAWRRGAWFRRSPAAVNWLLAVRLGCAGGRLQSAIQFGNEPLVCSTVVEFEADVVEAYLVQPVVNNFEGGHFLGDEQNRLTVMHAAIIFVMSAICRFQADLDDKAAPGANGLDHLRLRGIRIDNMYEINGTLIRAVQAGGPARPGSAANFAKKSAQERMRHVRPLRVQDRASSSLREGKSRSSGIGVDRPSPFGGNRMGDCVEVFPERPPISIPQHRAGRCRNRQQPSRKARLVAMASLRPSDRSRALGINQGDRSRIAASRGMSDSSSYQRRKPKARKRIHAALLLGDTRVAVHRLQPLMQKPGGVMSANRPAACPR
jgi:hypothetical protein